MRGIEVIYSTDEGLRFQLIMTWAEIDKRLLAPFIEELKGKPDVIARLQQRGCKALIDQLREYLICFYGGNDNRVDLDGENGTTSDYCHCGCRGGFCPDEGYNGLCSIPSINGARLNPAELDCLQMSANDLSAKQIATARQRSIYTVETQERTAREKLQVHSIAGAVSKGLHAGVIE